MARGEYGLFQADKEATKTEKVVAVLTGRVIERGEDGKDRVK